MPQAIERLRERCRCCVRTGSATKPLLARASIHTIVIAQRLQVVKREIRDHAQSGLKVWSYLVHYMVRSPHPADLAWEPLAPESVSNIPT